MINNIFLHLDPTRQRFKSLDGLRGIAVLFVLLSHSSNQEIFFHPFLDFHSIGKIGVYLFFVLSAYLLDRQIIIALLSGNNTKRFWLNYFLRRFLRIYPLFVIALLTYGAAHSLGMNTGIDFIKDTPLHLVFIKANTVFWSIAVEFKYYFISPLLLLLCHYAFRWKPLPTFIFLTAIIIVAILTRHLFASTYTATIPYLPVFMIGTMISIFEILIKKNVDLSRYRQLFELGGIGAFLLILISIPAYFHLITGKQIDVQSSVFFLPYGMLWGAVLVAAKYGAGPLRRFCQFKVLRFLGMISYSLYLFHMPVILWVDAHVPPPLKIYAFFGISILVAMASYLLIERPLSKIRLFKKELREDEIVLKP